MWDVAYGSRDNSLPIMNLRKAQLLRESSYGNGLENTHKEAATPLTKASTSDKEEIKEKNCSKGDSKSSARNVSGFC